jgi:hypothetical protein
MRYGILDPLPIESESNTNEYLKAEVREFGEKIYQRTSFSTNLVVIAADIPLRSRKEEAIDIMFGVTILGLIDHIMLHSVQTVRHVSFTIQQIKAIRHECIVRLFTKQVFWKSLNQGVRVPISEVDTVDKLLQSTDELQHPESFLQALSYNTEEDVSTRCENVCEPSTSGGGINECQNREEDTCMMEPATKDNDQVIKAADIRKISDTRYTVNSGGTLLTYGRAEIKEFYTNYKCALCEHATRREMPVLDFDVFPNFQSHFRIGNDDGIARWTRKEHAKNCESVTHEITVLLPTIPDFDSKELALLRDWLVRFLFLHHTLFFVFKGISMPATGKPSEMGYAVYAYRELDSKGGNRIFQYVGITNQRWSRFNDHINSPRFLIYSLFLIYIIFIVF